ncbi:ankyrin repeat and death domain-containing protein 1A-like isoform X4 [Schistocerca nitens]|nr:ankyrin repeat and death domain-containing protein 1A-like isoform X4 [Schistocerca nitens]
MEMLIAAKCDIEARDKYGMRPILMAAWHGHRDAVQMLINCGASLVAVNKKQYTLLMCAARNNRVDVLELLLETLEDVRLDATDAEQQTALFHAAQGGHAAVVQRLAAAGARADVRDKQGKTPLHMACERGHLDVVELLVRLGVDTNAQDEDGNTPLHVACDGQQTRAAQALLDAGCLTDPENKKGFTPLHVAASLGCRGIIESLLQHGSCINHHGKNGNTPLHMACQANKLETVELLVSKGADLNALNVRLQSPIHIAAEQGYTEICKLLLAAGANIDQREQGGKTPLYIAARGSFTAIVDMIIKTARLDYPANTRVGAILQCNGCPAPTARDYQIKQDAADEDGDGAERGGRGRRRWQLSREEAATGNERLRAVLWKVAYKQLAPGEWKRLAHHWAFTDEQIKAIEHQYTGPSSYKEHGFRMMLIWAHGLGPEVNPIKELYESLTAIDKKGVADALRKKLDQENEGRYRKCRNCNSCSIS